MNGGGQFILWLCSASVSASSVPRLFILACYWSWWVYRDFHTLGRRLGIVNLFFTCSTFLASLPKSATHKHTPLPYVISLYCFSLHFHSLFKVLWSVYISPYTQPPRSLVAVLSLLLSTYWTCIWSGSMFLSYLWQTHSPTPEVQSPVGIDLVYTVFPRTELSKQTAIWIYWGREHVNMITLWLISWSTVRSKLILYLKKAYFCLLRMADLWHQGTSVKSIYSIKNVLIIVEYFWLL